MSGGSGHLELEEKSSRAEVGRKGKNGTVSEMYMYEAAYYFIQAKIQMEDMELLDTEKSENHTKFVKEIGYNTIQSTCMVFHDGLHKLRDNIPEGTEKGIIGEIIDSIKPYIDD